MAEGGKTEEETLTENWAYLKHFLQDITNRESLGGLSNESNDIITNMVKELTKFVELKKTDGEKDEEVKDEKEAKTKKKLKKADSSQSDSSIASSTSISHSKSSSESEAKGGAKKKKRPKKKKPRKPNSSSSSENEYKNLGRYLKNLDNRCLPELEKFNENSNEGLEKYLDRFENYCKSKFRGDKYLWITELEKHLKGKTKEGLTSVRQFDDEYDEVRKKLLKWYKDEKEVRKINARKKFERARPKPGESYYAFSNRLETLFKTAYPKHKPENSNTLIYQFKAAVNNNLKEVIKNRIIAYKEKDKKLSWTRIKKCASVYDLEKKLERQGSSSEEDKSEIVINLNDSKALNGSKYKVDNNNNFKHNYNHHHKQHNFVDRQTSQVNNVNKSNFSLQNNSHRQFNPSFNSKNTYHNTGYTNNNHTNSNKRQDNNIQGYRYSSPPTNYYKCKGCGRFGHTEQNCRTILRACFICGNKDHFIRNCPQYVERYSRQNNNSHVRNQSVSPQRNRQHSNYNYRSTSNQRYHHTNQYYNKVQPTNNYQNQYSTQYNRQHQNYSQNNYNQRNLN